MKIKFLARQGAARLGMAGPGKARRGSAGPGGASNTRTPSGVREALENENRKTMNEENTMVRLPLWRNAFEKLTANGFSYGQIIPTKWFEEELKQTRDQMRFSLDISMIRKELEKDGYYLSGKGQGGDAFVILQPESHADVMLCYQRAAAEALRRGVILGTTTRLDTLKPEDRKRHESILEKIALKSVLMGRSSRVQKLLKEKDAHLLTGPTE